MIGYMRQLTPEQIYAANIMYLVYMGFILSLVTTVLVLKLKEYYDFRKHQRNIQRNK